MVDIRAPQKFHLDSFEDLGNWIVSASKGQHTPIYYTQQNGNHVLSALIEIENYYEFQGLPIHGFVIDTEEPRTNFIKYDIRDDLKQEDRISFVQGFDVNDSTMGYIQYFPIIKLREIPELLKI